MSTLEVTTTQFPPFFCLIDSTLCHSNVRWPQSRLQAFLERNSLGEDVVEENGRPATTRSTAEQPQTRDGNEQSNGKS